MEGLIRNFFAADLIVFLFYKTYLIRANLSEAGIFLYLRSCFSPPQENSDSDELFSILYYKIISKNLKIKWKTA